MRYAHEVHTYEVHAYEMHALEIHVRRGLGPPTLQTVMRWSICRDLSYKIRVFALRDKRSLWAAAHTLSTVEKWDNPSLLLSLAFYCLYSCASPPLLRQWDNDAHSTLAPTRRAQHSPFTFTACVLTLHLRRAQICLNS
jgi:hypothetical protein